MSVVVVDEIGDERFDEWQQVTRRLDNDTAVAGIDLAVHYDDVRETLGLGHDDSDLTIASIDSYYPFQQERLIFTGDAVNLAPTDHPARFSMAGNPVTVCGSAYELLRAMIGRRRRELADSSLDWGGADEVTRQHFSVYGWPAD